MNAKRTSHGEAVRRARRRASRLVGDAVGAFFDDRGPHLAASISYFALFSIFPTVIVLTAGFGLFIDDAAARDSVVGYLVDHLPLQESSVDDLRRSLEAVAGNAGAVGVLGLLGVLYSASALMGAVRNSLNVVWGIDQGRPPLRAKALDILLVFALGSLFAVSLGFGVLRSTASQAGRDIGIPDFLLTSTVNASGVLFQLAVTGLVFTVVLRLIPPRHQPLRDLWPGILVATVGYALVQLGFTAYLQNFGRFSAVYGSLGAVVAFMAFVYVAAMTFLLGAEFAQAWPAARAAQLDEDDAEIRGIGQRLLNWLRGLVVRTQ